MPHARLQQVAKIVRDARTELGWSQAELAEKVGVHKQTIGNLERASHQSEPTLISRLEEVLNVDLGAASIAQRSMLDMIRAQLLLKMREVGESKGLILAAEVLDYINEWEPSPQTPARGMAASDLVGRES